MRSLLRMLPNYHREGVIPPRPHGGGGSGGGGGGIDWPKPTFISSHVVDYCRQPGDQVIVVGDGDFDLDGFLNANPDQFVHAPTAGPYGGWLILLAQNYLGARIVGTENQMMQFDGGLVGRDFRIAFIGFDVDVYTQLRTAGYMRWVWTRHTNPIDRWWTTYTGRGGTMAGNANDRNILNSIVRWPSAFRIEPPSGTDHHSHHLGFYANDVTDVGDDGWYTSRVYDSKWVGARSWKIGHKGRDPGGSSPDGDFFHSDSLQVTGDFIGNEVTDSWLGYCTIAAYANGHMRTSSFRNICLAGSNKWGMQLAKGHNKQITDCEITGVRSFANSQNWDSNGNPHYYAPYDVPFDSIAIDANGNLAQNVLYPSTLDGVVANWDMPITGVDLTVPADVRMSGGNLVDINDIRDSDENPANVWRAAHTYDDVLTWLGVIGWP